MDVASRRREDLLVPELFEIQSLSFSPDGKWLAGCGHDAAVVLWEWNAPSPGRVVVRLPTTESLSVRTSKVAFSPKGLSLAVACNDGQVRIYRTSDWKLEKTLVHDDGRGLVTSIAFHPTVPMLATAGKDGKVKLWNLDTGTLDEQQLDDRVPSEVWALAFRQDGQLLACGNDRYSVEIWAMPSRLKLIDLKHHTGSLSTVAFGPGGRLATGGFHGLVAEWDSTSFQAIGTILPQTGREFSAAKFGDNSSLLATAGDGGLHLWSKSPQNKTWASLPLQGKTDEAFFRRLAFDASGKAIVCCGDETLLIGSLETNRVYEINLGTDRRAVVAVSWETNSDNVLIARRSGYIQSWNTKLRQLNWERKFTDYGNVAYAALNSKWSRLAWQTDQGVFTSQNPKSARQYCV